MRTTRSAVAVLLAAALLCLSLSGCAKPEPTTAAPADEPAFRDIGEQNFIAPASGFSGGSGTEDDPYRIGSAAELALLGEVYEIYAETLDAGDERVAPYLRAHYVLTADITLNDRADGADWSQTPPEYAWTPIGFRRAFDGVFDGAGHAVRGLYINADVTEKSASSGNCFGLFGENGGTIRNLRLEDCFLCVGGYAAYVGGIAGSNPLEGTSIEDCSVSGQISCYQADCGGVVGLNRGRVAGCSFSGAAAVLQEDAFSDGLGGIAGYNVGTIEGCTNAGSVACGASDGSVGGIAGIHSGGEISACRNMGSIAGGLNAGGIVGSCGLVGGGGELEAQRADVTDCENSGSVATEGSCAGGIAGAVDLDYSDYPISLSGCTNSGQIQAKEKTGGIAGLLTLRGEGSVSIRGCVNRAELSGVTVGGILASASELFGTLTVSDCENSGAITAELYGAGIAAENNLMTWDEERAYPLNVTILNCNNSGKVTTARGGGIAGAFVSSIPDEFGGRVTVLLENDTQRADIDCTSDNAFVGGILGNAGLANGHFMVEDCAASGTISFTDMQTGTASADERPPMELSRIAGGIAGMVKGGMHLSTENDGVSGVNVNADGAKIVFSGCRSDVTFSAPGEEEYTYADDGEPVVKNRFGGVIGFCTDAEGFGFKVEDCSYSGCERGLGVAALPDVGESR